MDAADKLSVAWNRVREDHRTDFILGDFEYHVYHRYRADLLQDLERRLRVAGVDFTPQPLRLIRVPKGSHTTRPGAVPEIDDRIVYQGAVDSIAHAVESNLIPVDDGVLHSYRYAGDRSSKDMFHLARLPAGRWGEPQDLQGAVVFLASPASDYIHGAIIPVDGGWLAR